MPALWGVIGGIEKSAGFMAALPVRVKDEDRVSFDIHFFDLGSWYASAEKLYTFCWGCKNVLLAVLSWS